MTDHLAIPENNLLGGIEYVEHLAFVYARDLVRGDVISDGVGTYQVSDVGIWDHRVPYVKHIRISHTLAGPIMGGLLRGELERIHLMARRRET